MDHNTDPQSARVESGGDAALVESSLIDQVTTINVLRDHSTEKVVNVSCGRRGDWTTGRLDSVVPPNHQVQPIYSPHSLCAGDSGGTHLSTPSPSSNLTRSPSYPGALPHQQPHSMPPPQHQYAYYHGEYSAHPSRHDSSPPVMVRDDGLPVRSLPIASATPSNGPITPTWDELHHLFQPLIQKTIQDHMAELKQCFQEQTMALVTSFQERFLEEQKKQHEEFLKHLEEREVRTQHSLRQVLQRQSAHELSLKSIGEEVMTTLTEMQKRVVEQQEQQHENLQQELYVLLQQQQQPQSKAQQRPITRNENQVHNRNGHTIETVERPQSELPVSSLSCQPPQQVVAVRYGIDTRISDLTIPAIPQLASQPKQRFVSVNTVGRLQEPDGIDDESIISGDDEQFQPSPQPLQPPVRSPSPPPPQQQRLATLTRPVATKPQPSLQYVPLTAATTTKPQPFHRYVSMTPAVKGHPPQRFVTMKPDTNLMMSELTISDGIA